MGRSDRPKGLGRFTAAGSLAEPTTWTPSARDDPADVALAMLQRHLLHVLPAVYGLAPESLVELAGVGTLRALAPYLTGERALATEHVLRLMHAFDLAYADLPASRESGSASLLPAAYRGHLRRTGTPGRVHIAGASQSVDWEAVGARLADVATRRHAAGLINLGDDGTIALDTVEALRDIAGLSPQLADRVPSSHGARIAYRGASELVLDGFLLSAYVNQEVTGALIRSITGPVSGEHVTVLVAHQAALLRLTNRFPALTALAVAGDTALLDSQDVDRAGGQPTPGDGGHAETTLLSRHEVAGTASVLIIGTTKSSLHPAADA